MKREADNSVEMKVIAINPQANEAVLTEEIYPEKKPTVGVIQHGGVYETWLQFCAIGLMAYIGAYIRVGIMYYRIWRTETNYVRFVCSNYGFVYN